MNKAWWIVIAVVAVLFISGIGSYNSLATKSQGVDAAWGNVQTNYQRRADLVPNLVNTVKGAANFEQQTLTQVIEARAQATSIRLDANDLTPDKIAQYQAAQNNLSGALGRLLAVAESYPQLQATAAFRDLQAQLEGTENRIAVSRKDFNDTVQGYNTAVTVFPGALFAKLFGYSTRGYFQASDSAQQAPVVDFNNTVTATSTQ